MKDFQLILIIFIFLLGTEVNDASSPSKSILVPTVNPDSSITEEQKPVTSNTEQSQEIKVSTSKVHTDKNIYQT